MTPRFWDDPLRRNAVIYVARGSTQTIPAILRVPIHVKSKADHDPEYLSRGGRGSKKGRHRVALGDSTGAVVAIPPTATIDV